MTDRHAPRTAAAREAQALGQAVAAVADVLRALHPQVQALVESIAEAEERAGRPTGVDAQRSPYGPPTGRRDR